MSRRRLLALGLAVALLTAPAGCGIPGHTDVRVDGGGHLPGADSGGVVGREPPKRKDSGDEVKPFALNFLNAAAGEASTAYERVADFIAPSSRNRLEAGEDCAINVVRLDEERNLTVTTREGSSTVKITVEQVGVLCPNGELQPLVKQQTTYTFVVGKMTTGDVRRADADADGLYVLDPPPVLLMTVDALASYYDQLTIYFWSKFGRQLVPDLRYLPRSVPAGRRATEVLGWLTGGPADWLKGSVNGFPRGTKPIGNVPENDGRLVVNLAIDLEPVAQDTQLKQLGTQLVWSLSEVYPEGRLELMIRDQSRAVFDVQEQKQLNPVYPVQGAVARYSILAGAIYRVVEAGEVADSPPPVAPAQNREIVAADLTRSGATVSAALVTTTGRLRVGSGRTTVERFNVSPKAYRQLGQPSWLRSTGSPNPVGLITAAGQLYVFGSYATLTALPLSGASGPVSAVSSGLDGRRVAFIAGGNLYVAALTGVDQSLGVGQARRVPTSLRRPAAVAWRDENTLVVSGQDSLGQAALYDVTVDGAVESASVEDLGAATVEHLVAAPYNPVRNENPQVMYEANGTTWSADSAGSSRIDASQLVGVKDPLSAGRVQPTAPFFQY
ncbi:MAG TPA: hypothetical protein VF462_16765 [Micromonosporaceae bacterium]